MLGGETALIMGIPTEFTAPIVLLREDRAAVLEALQQGRVDSIEAASDEITDLHVLYALKSGLLAECAAAFPDPRVEPEIPARVLLTASVAAAFQGEYALRESGLALHSPAILAELGLNAAWLAPGAGLSRRGTAGRAVFHGDTLRKLLGQVAEADRAAGRRPGESLLIWWNETVGPALLRHAGGGVGVWIRDVTKLIVPLNNPRYEQSEVATEEGKHPQRGYKLGLLSTLIDTGRLLVQVAWEGMRAGDVTVCRPFVTEGTPLQRGDTLLEDRGLLDGPEITLLKRDLGVDVVVPLKKNMLSYRLAVLQAERQPYRWKPHPTRPKQEIQSVYEIGGVWEECGVALNGCVVREWNPETGVYDSWVFATTNLDRSAKGTLADYGTRSECEEDHRQLKSPDWEMDEYTSRTLVEILYHVLMVLWAYNLCQLYGQTQAGERFAGKTKRARQREARREGEARLVVVAGSQYALLEWSVVAAILLEVEGEARDRLRALLRARPGAARNDG
jgi:DDE family transposase